MNKACPVVLRKNNNQLEILAFAHPLAGKQLVKGTIEPGERLSHACERELREESGLDANAATFLGEWSFEEEHQVWGFYLMEVDRVLPEFWEFHTKDDGGHVFKFFWQPLDTPITLDWHPLFVGALAYLRSALLKLPYRRSKLTYN